MADRPILFSPPMVRALLAGTKSQTRRVPDQPPAECSINYMLGNERWLPEDRKTPVRREFEAWSGELFRNRPEGHLCGSFKIVPRWQRGDRLYVREVWRCEARYDDVAPRDIRADIPIYYVADPDPRDSEPGCAGRFRQSMHMPRWASRLTLTVTDVRVQRLQDISEADAVAEGVERQDPTPEDWDWYRGWAHENGLDPRDPNGVQSVWLAPGTRQGFGLRRNDPKWGPTPQFAFRLLWDSINAKRGFGWDTNPWVVALTFEVERRNIDAEAR